MSIAKEENRTTSPIKHLVIELEDGSMLDIRRVNPARPAYAFKTRGPARWPIDLNDRLEVECSSNVLIAHERAPLINKLVTLSLFCPIK